VLTNKLATGKLEHVRNGMAWIGQISNHSCKVSIGDVSSKRPCKGWFGRSKARR